MAEHQFLFSSGNWIGQGKITFSHSPMHIRFYTKWVFATEVKGNILAEQQIEQEGDAVVLLNKLRYSSITSSTFEVSLSNELTGQVHGKGVIEPKTLAWEFRKSPESEEADVEGFEVYELQDNGDYLFHAEYFSSGQFRTIIDGRVWKKS